MAIIILEEIDRIDMGHNDIRSFKKDDVHVLSAQHEQRLIDLGLAAPAIPADAETGHALQDAMTDEDHAELQAAVDAMPEQQKAALAAAVEDLAAEKAHEASAAE